MNFSVFSVLFVAILATVPTNTSALTEEKTAEIRDKVKPLLAECAKESGITLQQMQEFKDQKKHLDDSNKCFFACFFKKIGLLDAKGLYSEEVALQMITDHAEESKLEKAKATATSCTSVNKATVTDGEAGCDRAKLLFDCVYTEKELYGF